MEGQKSQAVTHALIPAYSFAGHETQRPGALKGIDLGQCEAQPVTKKRLYCKAAFYCRLAFYRLWGISNAKPSQTPFTQYCPS